MRLSHVGGALSSNFGNLGFLVLIWRIYVVVMVTCEIKEQETHEAWVMSATVDF